MNDDLIARAKDYVDGAPDTYAAQLIAALVARCEQAEADADRLAKRVRKIPGEWQWWTDAEALRLHDEAVAQR